MNFTHLSQLAIWSNAPAPLTRPPSQHTGVFCRRCGWSGPDHARYCGHCGLRLIVRRTRNTQGYRELMRQGRRLRERGPAWQRLAIRSFHEALRGCPRGAEPLVEIARTYRLAGRPVRARRWYKRALRHQRSFAQAWIEGAATFGPYSYFRRAYWLANAVALRTGDNLTGEQLNRYYARLTGWQRWWIDRILRPAAASWARAQPGKPELDTRTC